MASVLLAVSLILPIGCGGLFAPEEPVPAPTVAPSTAPAVEAPPAPVAEEPVAEEPAPSGVLTVLAMVQDGQDCVLQATTFDDAHPAGQAEARARLPGECGSGFTLTRSGALAWITRDGTHATQVDLSTGAVLARLPDLPERGLAHPCAQGTCATWEVPSQPDWESDPPSVRAEGKVWPLEEEFVEAGIGLFRAAHLDPQAGRWVVDDTRALHHGPGGVVELLDQPAGWPIASLTLTGSDRDAWPGTERACVDLTGDPRQGGGEAAPTNRIASAPTWTQCEGARPWAHSLEWVEGPWPKAPVLVRMAQGWQEVYGGSSLLGTFLAGRWLMVTGGEPGTVAIDLATGDVVWRCPSAAPWAGELPPMAEPVAHGRLVVVELAPEGGGCLLRTVTFDADHPDGLVQPRARLAGECGSSWVLHRQAHTVHLVVDDRAGHVLDLSTGAETTRLPDLPHGGFAHACPAGSCATWEVPSELEPYGRLLAEGQQWEVPEECTGLCEPRLVRSAQLEQGAWVVGGTRVVQADVYFEALRDLPAATELSGTLAASTRRLWQFPVDSCDLAGETGSPLSGEVLPEGWRRVTCGGSGAWSLLLSTDAMDYLLRGPVLARGDQGWTEVHGGQETVAVAQMGRWLMVADESAGAVVIDLTRAAVVWRASGVAAPWRPTSHPSADALGWDGPATGAAR